MDIKAEIDDLKYQYDKAVRIKESLQKNLDRRKKLNLLDSSTESDLVEEIGEATRQADDLKRRMRSLESQFSRSRVISETHEKSPWDN
ncbi:MAG: hypothetical protein WCW13_04490 [archaeon]|jgi:hypothetical protein